MVNIGFSYSKTKSLGFCRGSRVEGRGCHVEGRGYYVEGTMWRVLKNEIRLKKIIIIN